MRRKRIWYVIKTALVLVFAINMTVSLTLDVAGIAPSWALPWWTHFIGAPIFWWWAINLIAEGAPDES